MRFSIAFAVVALASSASATFVARQSLPNCAIQCLGKADFDNCQQTDNACLCKSTKFVSSSTDCITTTCQGADLQAALSAAQQLCAAVGVTLTSTPAGLSTATGAQPTATAPAASGSKSAAASGAASSAAPAAAGSGAPAAASSGAPAATPTGAGSVNGVSTVASIAALGLAILAL